jgi:hypothetical protein
MGLDPGNARDETVDIFLGKAGVFEDEFRGFDVKLGGAEMRTTPTSVSAAPTIATLFFSDSVGTPQFIGKPKTRATLSCTILRVSPSGMLAKFCATFLRE